jgi:hypothetical protein
MRRATDLLQEDQSIARHRRTDFTSIFELLYFPQLIAHDA